LTAPHFRNALPPHSMLQEYRIEQVLGAGGFGITYRARDTNLDKDVALKEYLPGQLALRAADGNVVAQGSTHESGYRWGLERFLMEARTLAKFSHPHIVRVLRYFEANATAYMVMDYEQGDPLKVALQHDPQPPEAKLKALVAPLLDGLAAVHAGGFLHRDIKPDNIFVRANGHPVLIDFGAARQALGGETKSLTSILTPGYAPLEQYSGEGKQGPWTDLYAMGGVLYRAVTDRNPPDAVARMRGDSVADGLAAARGKYSEGFLRAIAWALALDEKQRPQSVEQWKAALLGEATVIAPRSSPPPATKRDEPAPKAEPPPRRRRWPWILGAVALVVIAANVVRKQRSEPPPAAPAEPAKIEAPVRAKPAPATRSPDAEGADKARRFREESEAEFRSADANGDGALSREEAQGRFPVLAQNFQRVDRDGDGRISRQEFVQARRALLERRQKKSDD